MPSQVGTVLCVYCRKGFPKQFKGIGGLRKVRRHWLSDIWTLSKLQQGKYPRACGKGMGRSPGTSAKAQGKVLPGRGAAVSQLGPSPLSLGTSSWSSPVQIYL